jgi:hypothetical protein
MRRWHGGAAAVRAAERREPTASHSGAHEVDLGDAALEPVAAEVRRVRRVWASAGRLHHAQSRLRRFRKPIRVHVPHRDSSRRAAAQWLLPRLVPFGGVPLGNARAGPGSATAHRMGRGLAALAPAGCRIVDLGPVRGDRRSTATRSSGSRCARAPTRR